MNIQWKIITIWNNCFLFKYILQSQGYAENIGNKKCFVETFFFRVLWWIERFDEFNAPLTNRNIMYFYWPPTFKIFFQFNKQRKMRNKYTIHRLTCSKEVTQNIGSYLSIILSIIKATFCQPMAWVWGGAVCLFNQWQGIWEMENCLL